MTKEFTVFYWDGNQIQVRQLRVEDSWPTNWSQSLTRVKNDLIQEGNSDITFIEGWQHPIGV